ncbi:MAG: hypothetical protein KDK10_00820 [Maritimibacter sp.]|nr:hypothetical protein [Maritimibacter sp.]
MPWILDTVAGRVAADISGFWSEFGARESKITSPWVAPEDGPGPLNVRLDSAPRQLPEYTALVSHLIFVGATARSLLDAQAPGSCRFTETLVTMPSGRPYERPVFLLTLLEGALVADGIVTDRSDVRRVEGQFVLAPDGRRLPLPPRLAATRQPPQLTWSRAAVGDRAIWADAMLRDRIIASDALYAAFKAAGVSGFQAQECRFATEH